MAEPTQQRLDELGERIEDARRRAEDDGVLDETAEPTFNDPTPDDDESDDFTSDDVQPPG